MARKAARKKAPEQDATEVTTTKGLEEGAGESADDLVLDGQLVCALTGEHRTATPQEETLQSFIEQLHREYGVALADMARDVRLVCYSSDSHGQKKKTRTVSLVVYESGQSHTENNLIRVVIVAHGAKADPKAIYVLEEVLGSISEEREQVFGLWTNGSVLAFRMRTYQPRTGEPVFTELTDFPAPHETLEDLENAERRPLRIAAGDSLL
jgi:hypothetical protein